MSGGEEADDELDALMAQYTATAEAERAAALAQEQQRKPRLKKHEREAQERQQALDKPLGHDTKWGAAMQLQHAWSIGGPGRMHRPPDLPCAAAGAATSALMRPATFKAMMGQVVFFYF
jgi:hypothetical protein